MAGFALVLVAKLFWKTLVPEASVRVWPCFVASGGGAWPPIDHVSFHGPSYPIADADIENAWSTLGTLNSSIRPTTQTPYEALAVKGIRSAVVYHFVYRGIGVLDKELPSAFAGFIDHEDDTGTALDDGTTVELTDLMDADDPNDPTNAPHIRPPQVLTVYYAGLDTNVHNNPNYPGIGATHLTTTDRYLGTLVRLLEQWNLMDEAMFTFTGDHGLTDVVKDDTHSLLVEQLADEELKDVFDALGLDVLNSVNPTEECDPDCDWDSVITLNGGMAHVYLRNNVTDDWTTPPRFVQDVLPVAQRFYDNTVGIEVDEGELPGSIELILVRNATVQEGWGHGKEL